MISLNTVLEALSEDKPVLRDLGVKSLSVFGSVARGDARDDSDVDFLVEVGPKHSAFFPGGLVVDLEAILGRRVDVVEREGLHRLLKDRVLREAVSV